MRADISRFQPCEAIPSKLRFINSEHAIAPIVGMASKKLNLAADSLSIPKNNAAEIVIPDLEVPGIKAKHCDKPITKDWYGEMVFKLVPLEAVLSEIYKTIPKTIVE
jgi:hypothetical protein